jgi:ubiquinone/menaquinone biosynthesis C-methylase UbiE
MNAEHLAYCAGPEWAETVRNFIIPWVTAGVDLGDHLLEVGPGPGATTDVLRHTVAKLTAVEVDAALAAALGERLAGTNVEVLHADATALPFEDGQFSAAICLTMLHHVPTVAEQDRILAGMARVVRPGGWVIGSDSIDSPEFRSFHQGDVCLPVPPEGLAERLAAFGLRDVVVETNPYAFKFAARAT